MAKRHEVAEENPSTALVAGGLVLAALTGVGAYFFFFKKDAAAAEPSAADVAAAAVAAGTPADPAVQKQWTGTAYQGGAKMISSCGTAIPSR